MKKRILAFALVIMMLFAIVPTMLVSADDPEPDPELVGTNTYPGTGGTQFPQGEPNAIPGTITIVNNRDSLVLDPAKFTAYRVFDLISFDATVPSYYYKLTPPFAGLNGGDYYTAFLMDYKAKLGSTGPIYAILEEQVDYDDLAPALKVVLNKKSDDKAEAPKTFEEFLQFIKVYRLVNDPASGYPASYDANGYNYWEGDLERRFNNDDWAIALTKQIERFIGTGAAIETFDYPVDYELPSVVYALPTVVGTNNLEFTNTSNAFGYYIVVGNADVNDKKDGETETNKGGTKGVHAIGTLLTNDYDREIFVKADAPTIEKEVMNNHDEINDWAKWTDDMIGSTIDFKVTSVVPDMNGYTNYKFTVWDYMSKGLDFIYDEDEKVGVTITFIDPTEEEDDFDFLAFDVTRNVTSGGPSTPVPTGGELIKIEFTQYFAQAFSQYAGWIIEIKYSAILNEKALVGIPGNPNYVKLVYSNNPYDISGCDTDETPWHEVIVFTGEFEIEKWAEIVLPNGTKTIKRLENAKFNLFKDDGEEEEIAVVIQSLGNATLPTIYRIATAAEITAAGANIVTDPAETADTDKYKNNAVTTVLVTPASGLIIVKGLAASYEVTVGKLGVTFDHYDNFGDYYLTEVVAPDGFNLLEDVNIEFTLTFDHKAIAAKIFATLYKEFNDDPTPVNTDSKNWWKLWDKAVDAFFGNVLETGTGSSYVNLADLVKIVNKAGVRFPETGGIGRTIFYIVGSLLTLGTGITLVVLMKTSKKKTADAAK